MKQLLLKYADHNLWANKRFSDLLVNLADDQLHKDINSSYRSIFKTMQHLWDVESIWWQRLKHAEPVEVPGNTFSGSIIEQTNHLLEQSKVWKEWIAIATETVLETPLDYKNLGGKQFTQPVAEIILHLFSHQHYHRGQIVTMLRQVGITTIPSTGFIEFARKK